VEYYTFFTAGYLGPCDIVCWADPPPCLCVAIHPRFFRKGELIVRFCDYRLSVSNRELQGRQPLAVIRELGYPFSMYGYKDTGAVQLVAHRWHLPKPEVPDVITGMF
jgi:hypothetical protein